MATMGHSTEVQNGRSYSGRTNFGIEAILFDMDGVLTDTARLHEEAWRQTIVEAFRHVSPEISQEFTQSDYRRLVDGKPRLEGVKSVLVDRGVVLPDGQPGDSLGFWSSWAIANRKDELFREILDREGAMALPGAETLTRELRDQEVKTAVVTASRNCSEVLRLAGLSGRFMVVVDGDVAASKKLAGKPRPDTYLEAAKRLQTPAARCAVIEDAVSGIQAGREGGFGIVIGVGSAGVVDQLIEAGAMLVVPDLADAALRNALKNFGNHE
jgi:beta-phosphoglucomutase family hydrolase